MVQTAALPAAVEALAASPARDAICAAAAASGAFVWVKIWNGIARRGWMDRTLTRKLVHATAGPLFVLTWPLFRCAAGVPGHEEGRQVELLQHSSPLPCAAP